MKLGILKTGQPPHGLERFGGYPQMFMRLLGPRAHDYRVFAADEGQLPQSPSACDAWLITGAAAGAYDTDPWIAALEDFLRQAKGRAPLVGVCFGHQIMAQAFGGKVIRSPKGWALGEQDYAILKREPWMDQDGAASIRLPASHRDQVVELPPAAEVIAGNDFAPMGALAYRDQPAISIQLHPEFEPAYGIALIDARRGPRFSDAQADAVIATYQAPDDRARVGRWINRFLDDAT